MGAKPPRRCLVTGGAGFIGSHVVEQLVAGGHEVAVLDDFSSGRREHLVSSVPCFELDIRGDISPAFERFQPDVVVHHAAQVSVSVSMKQPEEDATTNILGSINVLRTACEAGVEKIVYASSAAAYGPLETLPLEEPMRPMPVSAYGASKYTVEHYLRIAASDWGLPQWAALRYGNVYGPRQDPHGEAGVVAIFINRMLAGQRPTIFDDGELTRDYIFVDDVARANVAAIEADLRDHPDPVFNISTHHETTVNEIFAGLRDALGLDIEAEYAPPRPGDVRRSVLDHRKACEELDWKPTVEVPDGLQRTVEYFRVRA